VGKGKGPTTTVTQRLTPIIGLWKQGEMGIGGLRKKEKQKGEGKKWKI